MSVKMGQIYQTFSQVDLGPSPVLGMGHNVAKTPLGIIFYHFENINLN